MRRILRARLLASVLAVSVVPFVVAAVPAQAQEQSDVSFDSFHDQLAQYGDWVYSDRWGLVWQPGDVPDDFRPYYTGGHWAYTDDYGWVWASDYDWGDIAFHYGRWVDDPYDGWMWIPGYTWSPGWVVWRSNAHSIGWMPMPPDDQFLGGQGDVSIGISFGGVSVNWNDTSGDYGYSRWYGRDYDQRRFAANWTFVDTGHMADRDYRHDAYTPDRTVTIIHQTTNITNYTVVNNYMVNRSIDVHAVERASGHPIVAVASAAVFKHPNLVVTVAAGQKNRLREFDRAPHGTGVANSAPPPPPAVISKLSDKVAVHHAGGAGAKVGGAPSHLFTKTTIAAPAAVAQFHGKPKAGPIGVTPAGAPLAPTGPQGLHAGPTGGAPGGGAVSHTPAMLHPVTEPAMKPMTEPVVKPLEHKVQPPVTEPAMKPMTEPVVHPLEHKVQHPVTEPAMKPMTEPVVHPLEHKVQPPVTEPAMKPMTEPVVHPAPVVHTAPVVHAPPPVVQSTKPVATTPSEPKKDEHKKKGEHDTQN
jgi:hypothetical protein